MKKSAPTPLHQEISNNLSFELTKFVRDKKLGKIFTSPIDVYRHEYSHLLPDLVFISEKNRGIVDYKNGIIGVPDLVVEIISPSSVYRDRVQKNQDYEAAGVPEYWLVDSKNQSVEVYENKGKSFQIFTFASETGQVRSKILDGLELDITTIFPPET